MLQVYPKKRDSILSVDRKGDVLVIRTERGMLQIEPKRDDIIRIRYTHKQNFEDRTGIGICNNSAFADWNYAEQSMMDWSDRGQHMETASFFGLEKEICLYTRKLRLCISRSDCSIRYFNADGELMLAEREREPRELEEFASYRIAENAQVLVEDVVTADGTKKVIRDVAKEFDKDLYHTRLHLNFKEKECLYGLGQAEEGVLNLRGTVQYLHQANRKIAIPFLISTEKYGLLFATGSPSIFRDDQYGSYFYTEADSEMDYYFCAGGDMDHLISCYRYLTGKAAMLPRWAYGFIQSQERYETQKEILEVVKQYRQNQIGLDGIVLDWHSWEEGMWGQKTFDRKRFPDVEAMIDELHEEGVHFMISIWPNMSRECENYKEFLEKKMLLPASDVYDAFRREAREIYWKQMEEGIFRYGVDAWWCDSSEPFTPEWTRNERPEPEEMYEEFVRTASLYMPAEYCNAYGLVHAQGIYEGQRGSGSQKRVINLTRNGYTGQQRYGAILWSGDIEASWDTLRKQIAAGLNFCASGLPYWTLDIGGFFVKRGMPWYWAGEYDGGMDDLGYQELFVRWFQLGAFLPIFRSHGTDVRREMWMLNGPDNIFYKAVLSANQLRYRLMPYIYSLAGTVWKEDATMMRLLAFDFSYDEQACGIKDQFLFGKSLMVCPVIQPMYFGVGSKPLEGIPGTRKVYLPKGVDWYDFHTGERYQGGQTITAEAPIDKIPLYVRAGSIIPVAGPGKNAEESMKANIMLLVCSGADAAFDLYEDEGDGYGYEQGKYFVVHMEWKEEDGKLEIGEPVSPVGWKSIKREYRELEYMVWGK